MQIVKRFSDLGPAERNEALRLLSLRFALEAFKDPALTDQLGPAQISGGEAAISFAITGIQKDTAPPYTVGDPAGLKVRADGSGRVWIRLDAVIGDVVFLDALDLRVAELNAEILKVEGQRLSIEQKRAEGHRLLDEKGTVEEFVQHILPLVQANQQIEPQIEGLTAERDALLALMADVES